MGSIIIYHFDSANATPEEMINVMLPLRVEGGVQPFFQKLLQDGRYVPMYLLDTDDLGVAFDCGNEHGPEGVTVTNISNNHNVHCSTSVGDVMVVNGIDRYIVMPIGFEKIV